MPGMDGLELARHLANLENPPAFVFITAHDRHAVDAFEVNALDYLLKPVRATRLAAALKKAGAASREQVSESLRRASGRPRATPVARPRYPSRATRSISSSGRASASTSTATQAFGSPPVRCHRSRSR